MVLNYDVAAASPDVDARGIGKYDVWNISVNDVWSGSGGSIPPLSPNNSTIWYSPAVHNYVRSLDLIRYFGREDSAIVYYEVRDFGKSNLQVTGWNTSSLTVSIDITNIQDSTCNFNILCTLTNTSALCTGDADLHPYINGQLVYPNMSNINAVLTWTSWGTTLQGAIQQTGDLEPGSTKTLTWTIAVPTSGTAWQIWCAGLTNTPS